MPTIAAEDETAIKKIVQYCQKTDQLIGFCGMKNSSDNHHQCDSSLKVLAGDNYDALLKKFQEYEIGQCCHAVISQLVWW